MKIEKEEDEKQINAKIDELAEALKARFFSRTHSSHTHQPGLSHNEIRVGYGVCEAVAEAMTQELNKIWEMFNGR